MVVSVPARLGCRVPCWRDEGAGEGPQAGVVLTGALPAATTASGQAGGIILDPNPASCCAALRPLPPACNLFWFHGLRSAVREKQW